MTSGTTCNDLERSWILMSKLDSITKQWIRLGALFSGRPASKTPDIEILLINTAEILPQSARLQSMMISWITRYEKLICRHRLAAMAGEITSPKQSATLGLTLSIAKHTCLTSHFNLTINTCCPLSDPEPLFDVYMANHKMRQLAKETTTALGLKWGLWASEERVYEDAIRPVSWIINNNPTLKTRALFAGKLPASILATLEANPGAGKSESALARACNATRRAIREALDHLELCQLVTRRHETHTVSILLN